jgi:2-phospho-L-lactate guanylyltransferase
MPDVSSEGGRWSLLVPVKRLDLAKTRLALPAAARADITLAMACETVIAALAADAVAEVVVITDDERAASALSALGGRVAADRPNAGLNPALVHGASLAVAPRVAALSADLPALRPTDLDAVLRLATTHRRAVVADWLGSGTTLLTSTVIGDLAPEYGLDSRAAHVASGAVDLSADAGGSVRHDVDTVAALRAAVELGVGPHTLRALASLDLETDV